MARLKGGYYTLDFNSSVIQDLGLVSGTEKTISKTFPHPFIQRLNELFIGDSLKTDKPLLIKFNNDEGNISINFNSSSNALIRLGESEILLEISVDGTNYNITYYII